METSKLKEFIALAKHGKLAPAARELFMSPSTLSDHIIALENELGGPLFNRNDGFVLTAAGEEALERAQRILLECDAMQRACSQRQDAFATLTVPNYAFGLKPFLAARKPFHTAHPSMRITFKTKELEMADPFDILADGLVDVSCLYTVHGSGQDPAILIPPEFDHACVGYFDTVILSTRRHPLAGKTTLAATDLDGATLLTTLCPLAASVAQGIKALLVTYGAHLDIMYRKLNHHDDILAAEFDPYLLTRMVGTENAVNSYTDDIVVHTPDFSLRTGVTLVWDSSRLDSVQHAFMSYIRSASQKGESLL